MDKHVINVGVLFIAFGALGVLVSLPVLVAVIVRALRSGDETATPLISVVAFSIVVPFLLVEALKIVGGIALLGRQPWARILVLILSFLSLIMIPIGTAYGIYAIWVLMKDDTVRLLATPPDAP